VKTCVVYTAITGNKDNFTPPRARNDRMFDYVIFTDRRGFVAKGWKIIDITAKSSDFNRAAKVYKVLPHRFLPGYEYSIWLDGHLQIVGELYGILRSALAKANMAAFQHPSRNCIYKEYGACVKQKKDSVEVMKEQIEKYRADGYPENNGLIMGGALLRRHMQPDVSAAMEAWWKEILCHSCRDQLSFNYVAWKQRFSFSYIERDRLSRYFKRHRHRK
jgi:hypothetical protein